MSGAEPLAILGAVSSGLTLVKGTIEIIDRIISFNEGRKELPRAFGNLQAVLPLARISFERVRNRTLVIDDDKATSQMLEDVVNAFRRNMEELDKIFRKYLPRDDASWMRNAWTAIASFNQDERVHSLTTDIMRLVQVLSIHIEATSPTAEEITAVMAKEMNSQMDMKLQGVILDIQTRAPSNVSIENASIYNQQAISNSQQNVQFNDQAHVNITNTYNINIVSSQRLDDRKTVDSMTPKTKSQAGARKNLLGFAASPGKSSTLAKERIAEVQFETSPVPSETEKEVTSSLHHKLSMSEWSTSTIREDPIDFLEILDAASHLIEEGSKQVKGAPSAAKRAYVEAINKYASVKPNDPELLLRRYRGLTAAELGLTLVTTDQAKHLQRARDYNQKAQTTVLQSPSPNALAKVDLDSAAIITRSMKIESSNLASVNELRRQAFSLFNRAVNHLQTKANSIDELNILAQAFVGCGKTAEALRSAGISSDSTGNIIDIPSRYYEAGSRCVEHALQLPAPKADSLAKLQQMGRQLARPSIAELP